MRDVILTQQGGIGSTYGIVTDVVVKYFKYFRATFISYAAKESYFHLTYFHFFKPTLFATN